MKNDSNPTLSITTVTKDDKAGLEKTYYSIANQLIDNDKWIKVEWLIIDGGSSDGTIEFLSTISFQGNFKFVSESDDGIFDAMNKGLMLSTGNHILYLNAGDRLKNNQTLCELLKLVALYPTDIIAGRVSMHWDRYSFDSDLSPWVCHQSVLTPRTILETYNFDPKKKFFGDLDLWMRLQRDGLFNVKRSQLIVSDFDLGGVGNKPEKLWARLVERNKLDAEFDRNRFRLYRLAYTLFLIIVWIIFGKTFYYRTMWSLSGALLSIKNKMK